MTDVAVLESLAAVGGPVVVRGVSMLPAFPDGTTVDIEPLGGGEAAPGDVVLVRLPRGLRIHRVVGRDADGRYVTTGDSQWSLDPPVAPDAVLGRAVLPRPGRAFLSRLAGSLTLLRARFILRG